MTDVPGSRPPRVLHITEYVKGGTATYMNTLLGEQRADVGRSLARVRVLATAQHREHIDAPDADVTTYDYPARTPGNLRLLRRAIADELSARPADVVHLHGSIVGGIARTMRLPKCEGRRPAVVYCAHGWSFLQDTSPLKKRAYTLLERLLARRTDRTVCISRDEFEGAVAAGLPKAKLDCVLNALPEDPPAAEPMSLPENVAEGEGPLWLFVGRYDRQKGLDILLPAFEGDRGAGRLACVGGAIVGGDPLAFPPRTADLGWASPGQVQWLLARCDGLVVPSRWEGFGLVAAEAMRAGRAVIAAGRGGLPEVVVDGVTGRVVETLSADAFADALRSCDGPTLRAWGEAGRTRFRERFTAARMHAELLETYERARLRGRTSS